MSDGYADLEEAGLGTHEDRQAQTGAIAAVVRASSWDDSDPLLDVLEATECQSKEEGRKLRGLGGGKCRTVEPQNRTAGTGRRRGAPQTTIAALFGGGAGSGNGPRAGTKRPRPTSATSYSGRVKPPPPPPERGSKDASDESEIQLSWNRDDASGDHDYSQEGEDNVSRSSASGRLRFPSASRDDVAVRARWKAVVEDWGKVEDQLWPDKHSPKAVSSLAVHAKKIEEVRHWMLMALSEHPGSGAYRFLALVGPPGSAKSTTVRVLAEEMGVELVEWHDTSGLGGPTYRPIANGPALGVERPRHELGSSYQSALDSFEEFMRRSSYRSLSMLSASSPAVSGNLASRQRAYRGAFGGGRGGASRSVRGLDQNGVGGINAKARMILIEELPGVYSEEKKLKLQRLMADCARSSPYPIVLVWSQATENSSYQSQLEFVLSRDTLRAPGVQVTTCNPINDTLLRQHLRGVLAKEGISDPGGRLVEGAVATCRGDIRHALLDLQMRVGGGSVGSTLSSATTRGGGGYQRMRGCVAGAARRTNGQGTPVGGAGTLGMRGKRGSTRAGRGVIRGGSEMTMRDPFYSHFHAIGKLLYAKRSSASSSGRARDSGARIRVSQKAKASAIFCVEDREDPLEFIPEEIMSQSGMAVDSALEFLQFHCVDFYTNEEDLALGMGYMSDADLFVGRMYTSSMYTDGGDGIFPRSYAESIAARATAFSNRHPAKGRMRTFGAPKSFEMRRGRIEAMDAMRRFVWEAWDASDGDTRALWASSRHPKEIVDTELLPAARLITGEWQAELALRSLLHRFMMSPKTSQNRGASCREHVARAVSSTQVTSVVDTAQTLETPTSNASQGVAVKSMMVEGGMYNGGVDLSDTDVIDLTEELDVMADGGVLDTRTCSLEKGNEGNDDDDDIQEF